jgi:hypothetical protein
MCARVGAHEFFNLHNLGTEIFEAQDPVAFLLLFFCAEVHKSPKNRLLWRFSTKSFSA